MITPPVKSVTEFAKSPKITLPFILPAFDTFAAAPMTWIAGPLIPLIVAPPLFVIVPPLTRRMPIPPVIVPEFATSITAVPIVPTPTPLTPAINSSGVVGNRPCGNRALRYLESHTVGSGNCPRICDSRRRIVYKDAVVVISSNRTAGQGC